MVTSFRTVCPSSANFTASSLHHAGRDNYPEDFGASGHPLQPPGGLHARQIHQFMTFACLWRRSSPP